jgi:hypothetical protein
MVFAIDASPTLVAAYRTRLPEATTACETVERSELFGRRFEGVLSWGLLFLLPGSVQTAVVRRVAEALCPGGSFLFTAPKQVGEWRDASTGRNSVSLGRDRYIGMIVEAGSGVGEYDDEGDNHYYEAVRAR